MRRLEKLSPITKMPEQVIATPAVEVQAPPALNRSLADAVKAALSGQEQPKPAEVAKAVPEPTKPTVEVATRDKQGRFTQVGQPAQEDTKTDEAKPAEPKTEQAEAGGGPKQLREAYEKLKAEHATAKAELEKARSALTPAEYESAKTELAKLKQERDSLSESLKVADVARHPDFQREFVAPIKAAENRLLQYVPDNLKGTVKFLAEQPPSAQRLAALEQAVSELSPIAQAAVVNAVESYSNLIERRDAAVSQAKTYADQLEQRRNQDAQRKASEQTEFVRRHIHDALTAAAEEIPLFKERDGDEAWNGQVASRRAAVESLLTKETDPSKLAEAAVYAEIGRASVALLPAAEKKIAELTKQLEELKASRPMAPKQGALSQPDKPKTFMEAMKRALAPAS